MQAPTDLFEQQARQMQEQAAANERGRKANVELFTRMFLSLGADCIKLAGSRFDSQLAEARGLAAWRWSKLLDLEAQVQREEAELAGRPKKRPPMAGDDVLPDRTLAARESDWEAQTQALKGSLAALKRDAELERRELESFIRKGK